MGLLDDLKKQADDALRQAPSARDLESRIHPYFEAVHEALQKASRYLGELAQSLNVVKPDIRRQFYIEGSTKLSNLLQGDYTTRDHRKTIGGNDYLTDVSLHCMCSGTEQLAFDKETRQANLMKEYLWAYGVPFQDRDIRDSNGRIVRSNITLSGKIPSVILLVGNWDTGGYELTLRNVELLGEVKQSFDAADINSDFFEEIGKVVLAQPNNLRSFGKRAHAPLPASFAPPRT